VGTYEGALRRAIVSYKYGGERRWAEAFATMLVGFLARHAGWFEEYTVLCPVPSYRGTGARRPWGPVETFCSEVPRLACGLWPVEELVAKVAETGPVTGRKGPVRREMARQTVRPTLVVPRPHSVKGARILLVDDVCTSGATLLAVARALMLAGADEVAAVVLARARWRGGPLSEDEPQAT
jgi:predicted amidophosphoribosyltransferase